MCRRKALASSASLTLCLDPSRSSVSFGVYLRRELGTSVSLVPPVASQGGFWWYRSALLGTGVASGLAPAPGAVFSVRRGSGLPHHQSALPRFHLSPLVF